MSKKIEFVPLDHVNSAVVEDFVPLLSELSSSFASYAEEDKRYRIQRNLTKALEANGAFVLIHRDEDSGKIVSTATGNIVAGEGWVDDVVTRELARGRGLGRESMRALHERFTKAGIMTVRLTSSFEREAAGNLYTNLGYVEDGQVWRTALDSDNVLSGGLVELFNPVNCYIPTGNKAWIYGPSDQEASAKSLTEGMMAAGGVLLAQGISSVNYFTGIDGEPRRELTEALTKADFAVRKTRLYTRIQSDL